MTMTAKSEAVVAFLKKRFPDAKCALNFSNPFECLVAVMLSAQTTDASVNKVTPSLFSAFPNAKALSEALPTEVEPYIHSLGLFKNKAKNLVAMAKALMERHQGEVPSTKQELVALPGVGIKTANVVGAECFAIPAIAVDTHVHRVAFRLGYSKKEDAPERVEAILEKAFPHSLYIPLHHQLIHFGRAICHAQKPDCGNCELGQYCRLQKKSFSKTGK